jgi:preprotein translocase subunit YajC
MRVFFFQITQHAMTKMSSVVSSLLTFAEAAAPQTAAPGAQPSAAQGLLGFLPMLLAMAGLYFLFIAPQMKKQKQMQKAIAALQTGDEIVTSGGIYGVITNVKDDRFVVRIAENTKVEIGKSFVQSVVKQTADKTDK